MKLGSLLLTAVLSAAVAFGVAHCAAPKGGQGAVQGETAFERVMRTQTLRCGYILYSPIVIKDPNTGKLSGILVDAIDEMGRRLDWKVDWVEELSYGTSTEGLNRGRYDLVCTALWGFPQDAKIDEFVGPFLFEPIGVWVRTDDHRFDGALGKIDDPSVTISGVDGTFPAQEAKAFFPKAKLDSLPQSADYAAPLMDVMTRKADVTFINNSMGLAFARANPGKIRNIAADPPFRIFPIYAAAAKGAFKLQSLLNNVLNLMQNDGSMERIVEKYEKTPGAFYPVARPYQVPK